MKFVVFVLLCGLLSGAFAAPKLSASLNENDDDGENEVAVRNIEIEERASPGILGLIQSFQGLLQTILGILEGNAAVSDLANSMQKVFMSLQSVLDVRGTISKIPIVGVYLTPALDAVGTIVGDSGMLGGLMSQVITGPDYPSDPSGNLQIMIPKPKPKPILPLGQDVFNWFQ